MKTKLLLTLFIISFITLSAQTTVNTSMGASYANMVYYKLGTQTETTFPANSWDMAFLRISNYNFDLRTNDHNGIEVFEASNNIADWATIDLANEGTWTQLRNSYTQWGDGALGKGSATYGWGEYNSATHHVSGSVIFVLKYSNGDYVKFINEDYYGGYTFKYAKWDATNSVWLADQTVVIPNTNNSNNTYNYFSFQNDVEVVAEPATTGWDFVFTKYAKDYYGDGTVYYPVTGVLHNSTVQVAENINETDTDPLPAISSLTFSDEINTIGDDWKHYNSGYTVDNETRFYVKYADDTIYRMWFTSFTGGSTGDLTFQFENVTTALDIEDVSTNFSFGMYPNPSLDKQITIVYDTSNTSENEIEIYNINGQQVYNKQLTNANGFYNQTLNLNHLANGMYLVKIRSGNNSITKKLILK